MTARLLWGDCTLSVERPVLKWWKDLGRWPPSVDVQKVGRQMFTKHVVLEHRVKFGRRSDLCDLRVTSLLLRVTALRSFRDAPSRLRHEFPDFDHDEHQWQDRDDPRDEFT